jgi:hypothetical protein
MRGESEEGKCAIREIGEIWFLPFQSIIEILCSLQMSFDFMNMKCHEVDRMMRRGTVDVNCIRRTAVYADIIKGILCIS